MDDHDRDNGIRLNYAGPARRSRSLLEWVPGLLLAWFLALAGAVTAQRLTADLWVGTMLSGTLWYRLPLGLIVAIGTAFCVAARWRVSDEERGRVRAVGLALTGMALIASGFMCFYYFAAKIT